MPSRNSMTAVNTTKAQKELLMLLFIEIDQKNDNLKLNSDRRPIYLSKLFFPPARMRSVYQYIKKKVGEKTQSTQVLFCFSGENKPVEIKPLTQKLSL